VAVDFLEVVVVGPQDIINLDGIKSFFTETLPFVMVRIWHDVPLYQHFHGFVICFCYAWLSILDVSNSNKKLHELKAYKFLVWVVNLVF